MNRNNGSDCVVIPFRDPDRALEGVESFPVRRAYRIRCNALAEMVISKAFSDSYKGDKAMGKLDVTDVGPIFIGAMRGELRKVWPGLAGMRDPRTLRPALPCDLNEKSTGSIDESLMKLLFAELKSITEFIRARFAELRVPADRRSRMSLGCLDLAIEHQVAIAILIDNAVWGPAFSLVRCLFDAFVRGVWLARCATDSDLDLFARDGFRKVDFTKLVDEVEAKLGHQKSVLSTFKTTSWSILSDFTHTGIESVRRRNSATTLGQSYPREEQEQVIQIACSIGLLAAIDLADLAGHPALALACNARLEQFVESLKADVDAYS